MSERVTTTPFGELPRDPAAYRPSDHFGYRFRTRDDPPITAEVVRRCITEGTAKNTQVSNIYFFEAAVPWGLQDVLWRVVVALDEGDPPYTVVTAYSPTHHDADHKDPSLR